MTRYSSGYEAYRRRERRWALLRFIVSWGVIVIVCLFTLFGVYSALVLLFSFGTYR